MVTLNLPSKQKGEDLYLLSEACVCSMYIICVFGCEFRHMLLYVEARGQPWALVLTFTLRKGLLFTIRYSRLVGLCTSRSGFVSTFYGHCRSAAITDVCFCVFCESWGPELRSSCLHTWQVF